MSYHIRTETSWDVIDDEGNFRVGCTGVCFGKTVKAVSKKVRDRLRGKHYYDFESFEIFDPNHYNIKVKLGPGPWHWTVTQESTWWVNGTPRYFYKIWHYKKISWAMRKMERLIEKEEIENAHVSRAVHQSL